MIASVRQERHVAPERCRHNPPSASQFWCPWVCPGWANGCDIHWSEDQWRILLWGTTACHAWDLCRVLYLLTRLLTMSAWDNQPLGRTDTCVYFTRSLATSWCPVELQISTWLDLLFWRYCHCKILAFWLENAYSGLFLAVFEDFDPIKLWYRCSNPQRNAIFPETRVLRNITRQNRSSGLTPSCAKEQIKKHRPLTCHPFVGVIPWTDWHAIWGTE